MESVSAKNARPKTKSVMRPKLGLADMQGEFHKKEEKKETTAPATADVQQMWKRGSNRPRPGARVRVPVRRSGLLQQA